jgi:hypothetical protein
MPAPVASENLTGDISSHQPTEKADRMKGVKPIKLLHIIIKLAAPASLIRPVRAPPTRHSSSPHSAARNNGAAQAAAAASAAVPPPPPCRFMFAAERVRRRGEHGHARPPAQAREAAQNAPARGTRRRRPRHRNGVVQPVPGQLGVRRHAADVRHGGVPLCGAGVQLPEVRPPRQAVPQVPVAPGLLRAPEVLLLHINFLHECSVLKRRACFG